MVKTIFENGEEYELCATHLEYEIPEEESPNELKLISRKIFKDYAKQIISLEVPA